MDEGFGVYKEFLTEWRILLEAVKNSETLQDSFIGGPATIGVRGDELVIGLGGS